MRKVLKKDDNKIYKKFNLNAKIVVCLELWGVVHVLLAS